MAESLNQVPQFIRASNPKQLVRKMLENNLKHKKKFQYQIMKDGSFFLAWYVNELPIRFPRNTQPGMVLEEGDE